MEEMKTDIERIKVCHRKQVKQKVYTLRLFNYCQIHHSMVMIRSYDHQLHSIPVNTISLNLFDDKRFAMADGNLKRQAKIKTL